MWKSRSKNISFRIHTGYITIHQDTYPGGSRQETGRRPQRAGGCNTGFAMVRGEPDGRFAPLGSPWFAAVAVVDPVVLVHPDVKFSLKALVHDLIRERR